VLVRLCACALVPFFDEAVVSVIITNCTPPHGSLLPFTRAPRCCRLYHSYINKIIRNSDQSIHH
jgi:hypothetical protein